MEEHRSNVITGGDVAERLSQQVTHRTGDGILPGGTIQDDGRHTLVHRQHDLRTVGLLL